MSTPDAALPAAAPVGRGTWSRFFSMENRFLAPILITLILAAGQISFGFLEGYSKTCLAILTSMATEIVLGRIFTGRVPHLASAYITGISVGILVRSPDIWPFAVCAALSISSKYLLRTDGRHIWNPSNFGICAMLFLAYDTVASLSIQWGNNLLPMVVVWCLGTLIIYRLGRFHITLTYVASFVTLSMVRSAITGHPWLAEIAPITGPMYQLYIFFMITDPKTTVTTKRGQILVAFLIAVAEALFRLNHVVHAPYYALFIVGPIATVIDLARRRREKAAHERILAAGE